MYGTCNRAGYGHAHQHFGKGFSHRAFGGPLRRPKYNVPVNIAETETAFEVSVYAVGFSKENIRLSVADDSLYITGTRDWGETQPPQFTRQEFPVKTFERVIALGEGIDTTNIRARQEDGVLYITLPKTAEAQKPSQEIKVD